MTVNEAVMVESPSTAPNELKPTALLVGGDLQQNQAIISHSGLAYLVMQGDNNLCSYLFSSSNYVVSSHTSGSAAVQATLTNLAVLKLQDASGNDTGWFYPDPASNPPASSSLHYRVEVEDNGTVSCYGPGRHLVWNWPNN